MENKKCDSCFRVEKTEGVYKYHLTLPETTGSTNGDILMLRLADVVHEASSVVSYFYNTNYPWLGDSVKTAAFEKFDEAIGIIVKTSNFLADELREANLGGNE